MTKCRLTVVAIGCATLSILAVQAPASSGGAPSGHWPSGEHATLVPAVMTQAAPAGTDIELGGSNEVTIVVNPTDPRNLAMSTLFQSRVSTDNGQTWTPPQLSVVPSGYLLDGDPTLAFDSQGRLFYGYQGFHTASNGADEFVAELSPTTGAYLSGPVQVSTSGATGAHNDKPWLAADTNPSSPFTGRLYLVWTEFTESERVLTSHSDNHGLTWSPPLTLSDSADGFPWPAHVAVAMNGNVYVSYHSQTGFLCNPDGISGKIYVLRSTNGGVSFPQKTLAYGPGQADITFNVQYCGDGVIPNTDFWMQGSAQGWILPDPFSPRTIYVVTNDDPDDAHASGDDGNVYIARSDDYGVTWSTPARVDHGPGTSLQVFPTAAIDGETGCIAVMWYDTRNNAVNSNGNYFLDVFYTVSSDGGVSFGPDVQLNDVPFDPDRNAPIRFAFPPPVTRRIGEYIGAAIASPGGTSADFHGVWTGNAVLGQQAVADNVPAACTPGGPPRPHPDPGGVNKNRFISVTVPSGGQTALRVALVDLQNPVPSNAPGHNPPDYSAYEAATCTAVGETNACARWVGKPATFYECGGGPPSPTYVAARLQCIPFYFDWSTVGLFHITGAEIVPSSAYDVRNFGPSCAGIEPTCSDVSGPLRVNTARWGDVAAAFNPPTTATQPNALDVAGMVNTFKCVPGSPPLAQSRLQPNLTELLFDLSALDLSFAVDAVKGYEYPFSGPCPCPSMVVCDSVTCPTGPAPCVTAFGPSAVCVETCSGGANDGGPCRSNMGCPGGTCGNPFCRDRCGRCSP